MKKKEAIGLYKALSQCKLTGLASSQKMVVLNNLRKLRPVSETYDADIKEAMERMRPDGLDEMLRKAREHNESIASGKGRKLPDDELASVTERLNAFNNEIGQYALSLLDEESGVEVSKIDPADLERLIDINDLPTDQLCVLYDALGE